MSKLGQLLWVDGYMIGPDRIKGDSPLQFGSDATVGLATVAQIGGQLLSGVNLMLPLGNRYATMALIRQLVEVEYLAWAFTENQQEAAAWLRSTKEERIKTWQPRHLRDRSDGLFGGRDYQGHCERGGHPTPEAVILLPDHTRQFPVDGCWLEATIHGASIWGYLTTAAHALCYEVGPEASRATAAVARWRDTDPARRLKTTDVRSE